MSDFVQDNLTEVNQHPVTEVAGLNFREPDEIAHRVLDGPIGSINHAEIAQILLAEAGVEVELKRKSPWYILEGLPENGLELVTRSAEERTAFAKELYDFANERLATNKRELPKALADYAKSLGIMQDGLEELFASRIATIQEVGVTDWVLSLAPFNFKAGTRASFNAQQGTLTLNAAELRREKESGKVDWKSSVAKSIDHELEHAVSYTGANDHGEVVRSGLLAADVDEKGKRMWDKHGSSLLDEGVQEFVLWKGIHLSDSPTYEASVMVLEMLMGLDSSIERLCFEAKFLGKPSARGELVGKVEQLLGPHSVEVIEKELLPALEGNFREFPDFKDAVVKMLDQDKREKGRLLLDKAQLEILIPRGLGYSDEQLREIKRTGKVLDEPKYKEIETQS